MFLDLETKPFPLVLTVEGDGLDLRQSFEADTTPCCGVLMGSKETKRCQLELHVELSRV